MMVIGIDPGLSGAVAVLDDGKLVSVDDTPVLRVGKKHDYSPVEMRLILSRWCSEDPLVVLELTHAMPKQGATSMWRMGYGAGLWRGIITALGMRLELVTPQRWKKAMLDGRSKEKAASILRAKELFPDAPLTLKKHHGRGDAILLCEWGRRNA